MKSIQKVENALAHSHPGFFDMSLADMDNYINNLPTAMEIESAASAQSSSLACAAKKTIPSVDSPANVLRKEAPVSPAPLTQQDAPKSPAKSATPTPLVVPALDTPANGSRPASASLSTAPAVPYSSCASLMLFSKSREEIEG